MYEASSKKSKKRLVKDLFYIGVPFGLASLGTYLYETYANHWDGTYRGFWNVLNNVQKIPVLGEPWVRYIFKQGASLSQTLNPDQVYNQLIIEQAVLVGALVGAAVGAAVLGYRGIKGLKRKHPSQGSKEVVP